MKIHNAAVMGAGAVGSVVLKFLYDTYGDSVYVVAGGERRERFLKDGLCVNNMVFRPLILDCKSQIHLDLLIVALKNYHLDSALQEIADFIDEDTIILPLLNGISATDTLQKRFPQNRVFYGIVMRTDAERIKHKVTYSTAGEIQLGYQDNTEIREEVAAVASYINKSGINTHIYPDMRKMLWRKWMINIAANPVSLITCAKFKHFAMEDVICLMRDSLTEILEIARQEGICVNEQDIEDVIQILIHYPPEKKSSMLQDLEAERKTENEAFSGKVVELGEKYGILTPVNRTLFHAIRARESIYLTQKK